MAFAPVVRQRTDHNPYPKPSSQLTLIPALRMTPSPRRQDRGAHAKPSLQGLPHLHNGGINHHARGDHAPLPGDGIVFEHDPVHNREVDDGEGNDKPGRHGAKQEAVLPDRPEH